MGGREGAGRGVTHFMSAALSGSIRLRSLLMKSHSSPANSTPVGPPPTTNTLSNLSRSVADLQYADSFEGWFCHHKSVTWASYNVRYQVLTCHHQVPAHVAAGCLQSCHLTLGPDEQDFTQCDSQSASVGTN